MKRVVWRLAIFGLAALTNRPALGQETIRFSIENEYFAWVNAGIGKARRGGTDSVVGELTLQSDGTWQGTALARVKFKQAMEAFGIVACPEADHAGTQRLHVSGTRVTGFNATSQTITLGSGTAGPDYLMLSVQPIESAAMDNLDCLTLFEDEALDYPLLPLNDARWTQPRSGYVIGLPQGGLLTYTDGTVRTFREELDSTRPAEAFSVWKIRIERP